MGLWKRLKKGYKIDVKGSCHILSVLMWKNAAEHKHCWRSILLGVTQGCSVFIALLMIRLALLPSTSTRINESRSVGYNVDKILFSPRNFMTLKIMESVRKKLNSMTLATGNKKESFELDFYNETMLLEDHSNSVTIVDFKDEELKTNNFTYSITTVINNKPKDELPHPFREFFHELQATGSGTNPVLRWLQWAIDSSYIELHKQRTIFHGLKLNFRKKHTSQILAMIQSFIHMCVIIAPLPNYFFKAAKLGMEKRIGFQNLLKLSGVSSNMYRISHLLSTIMSASIYALTISIILKVTQYPILPYSNPVIIFITIVLYFLYNSCMAFVTSTITTDYHYCKIMALLVYIVTFLIGFEWFTQDITSENVRVGVCCILPHAPIFMFWDQVIYLESLGKGATFSEITEWHSYHLPIIIIWLVLLMHVLCLMIVDWYLDLVIPCTFGVARKWNFIFKKRTLCPAKRKIVNFHVTAEQTIHVLRDSRYFEDLPDRAEIAVKIINLTKEFKETPTVVALSDVCLDVCRGEVTVILGNLKSGKSTLLCIISGMLLPTSGKVYVNGMDNVARLSAMQDIVSFCPQQIVLERNLTVRENITFFAKLRKKPQISMVDNLIRQLQLTEYEKLLRKELPKGLRRCLQVACCIASGAEVLVFDEPTRNMGIESRHRVWDLFMKLRGRKTIIISTTVLEEASALGDRIAILDKGKVRCHGSSSFLRDAIGIGLNLTITLQQPTYVNEVKSLVESVIPDVKSQAHSERCIIFMLPQKERHSFVRLVNTLEEKKQEYHITTIDVGMSMEAVYEEFIERFDDEEDVVESDFEASDMTQNRRNSTLVLTQFKLLITRVYCYLWMKKYQFIFMQVLIPLIILFVVTLTTNRRFGYGKFVLLRDNTDTLLFHALTHNANRYGRKDVNNHSEVQEKTDALNTSEFTTKMLLPNDPYELSKSVNMFSNLYMKLYLPNTNKTIFTKFKTISRHNYVVRPKPVFHCIYWSVWVSLCSILTLVPFVMLSISEKNKGTRDIQIMAGCSVLVLWCSKLLAHLTIYSAVVPIAVIISVQFLDYDNTFNHLEFVGVLFVILIIFASAFLTHLQFLTFMLHDYMAIGRIYCMSFGFGIIVPVTMLALEMHGSHNQQIRVIYFIFLSLVYFSPIYVLSMSLFYLVSQARLNAYCLLNKHLCPNLYIDDINFSTTICCQSTSRLPYSYLDSIMGMYIMVLVLHSFLYLTIVMLLQKRIIQYWVQRIVFRKSKDVQPKYYNAAVERERALVRDTCLQKRFTDGNLIVQELCKKYYGRKNKVGAIHGFTLLAKKGECIGILGPSRAGKSTVLRILAGCVMMTEGDCWVTGYNLRADRSKYLRKIGLVASTEAVDEFYTGYENLVLICQIAGYSKRAAERMSSLVLQDLGLNSYANILVKSYTASCWHRLLLCIVSVLNPAVAFIDEPMMHADHATNTIIARALEKLVAKGTTVIIAETSLDWHQMGSVYNRLAILNNGQMAAIGPAADIMHQLTSGFSVHIKKKIPKAYWLARRSLFQVTAETDYINEVQALKDDFKKEFETSVLVEDSVCIIFFYIKDEERQLSYNELYSKLHKIREKHSSVIECYTFNKTTVEEVFWRIPQLIDDL